jgi:protoporphyrinogen oxidase
VEARANRWAVVGGGLLGMEVARRLAQRGERVTLLEAAPRLGGLASTWSLDGVVWDRHYHVTLATDSHLLQLLRELGLEPELRWKRARTGFYSGGRLHSLSGVADFLRFPPLGLVDKLRLGITILHAARLTDWEPLEEVPVEDWLCRWSGRRTFERIWLPLLRAKLGENYRRVSAAFIWATIARMYGARGAGPRAELFGHVTGGYRRVLERFGQVLASQGVELRTGRALRAVRPAPGAGLEVTLEDGATERFDRVVLTLPAPLAAGACPDLSEQEKSRLLGVEYQGLVCASVLLARPLAGYYVTNITDPGLPFTAVIEMSALVDPRSFGGLALVYLPRYVGPEDPAMQLGDDELRSLFLAGLERMYPDFRRADVRCFQVSRVRHVFPLPTLGFSKRLPPIRTSVPGLFAVSSAHIVNGTLNVNETLRLAGRAAAEMW